MWKISYWCKWKYSNNNFFFQRSVQQQYNSFEWDIINTLSKFRRVVSISIFYELLSWAVFSWNFQNWHLELSCVWNNQYFDIEIKFGENLYQGWLFEHFFSIQYHHWLKHFRTRHLLIHCLFRRFVSRVNIHLGDS